MKPRDLRALLNRAAAALEDIQSVTPRERAELIEDLIVESRALDPSYDVVDAGGAS